MKIKYTVSIKDLFALNEYVMANSKFIRRNLFKARLIMTIIPLITFILFVYFEKITNKYELLFVLFPIIIFSVLSYLYYPRYRKHVDDKNLKRMYSEGKNKGVFGKHEIIIQNDGILEKTEYNETKQKWESIDKIVTLNEYTFIFISVLSAYIISRNSVIEGSYDTFISELTKRYNINRKR